MYSQIHSGDTCYIAGPMSGLPDLNYPAFNRMAAFVKFSFGCEVVDPATNFGGDPTLPREAYLREDFGNLSTRCTAIVFLPGWEKSQGAIKEYLIGSELKMKMYDHKLRSIKPFDEKLTLVRVGHEYKLY